MEIIYLVSGIIIGAVVMLLWMKNKAAQQSGKAGEELAGHAAVDADAAGAVVAALSDGERGVAGVFEIADVRADAAQGGNEVADGAFVHAGDAAQGVAAAEYGERGGERAEGGAGVAEEQVGLLHGETAAAAVHFEAV